MSKPFMSLGLLSLATKISVGLLAATLLADQSRHLKGIPFEIGDPSHNVWMIPAFWAGLLAPGFYLFALWAASDVFDRMDKGDAFGPAVVKGLRDIGGNLIYGACAAIFIAPTLVFLVDTGFRRLTGLKYHLEIESLTIGLIGFVLYLLARQGQALKSELDQIV